MAKWMLVAVVAIGISYIAKEAVLAMRNMNDAPVQGVVARSVKGWKHCDIIHAAAQIDPSFIDDINQWIKENGDSLGTFDGLDVAQKADAKEFTERMVRYCAIYGSN